MAFKASAPSPGVSKVIKDVPLGRLVTVYRETE